MKKQILSLLLMILGGIFFAGFNEGYNLIPQVHAENNDKLKLKIYQKAVSSNCLHIKAKIVDFDIKKTSDDFDYNKFNYQQEAYKKELEAYIALENAVSCLKKDSECRINSFKDSDKISPKDKCFETRNGTKVEITDALKKLEQAYKEFQNSAKLFDQSSELYFESRHLPLSKQRNTKTGEIELDTILTNNIVIRTGKGLLYSTQDQLVNIFRGDLIKMVNRILGAVAILFLFVLGIKFIMSRGDSERLSQLKEQFAWIVLGLGIVSVAEFTGYEVFDPSGKNDILEGVAEINFNHKVREIVRYLKYFAGGLMLINALISGYGLIMSGEEEESISREKQFLKSFLIGTAFILMAEVIVRVLSLRDGLEASARIAVREVAGLVNFSLSFIGIIAVAMLVMSGLYYVISFGDEEQMGRAKRMIMASVIGVIITFSAYTIIRFLIV